MKLDALRSYARGSLPKTAARCEMCGAAIGEPHPHVAALEDRSLACACRACAILFRDARAGGGRWRTVPDRVLVDPEFAPTDEGWAALGIPVRLAFLVVRAGAWTAFYPSPLGPVETALDAAPAISPLATILEDDVEALLVRRPRDCLLVPVDACYELVGILRRTWRGFQGGDEAAQAIDDFFARLHSRARPPPRKVSLR